MSMEKARKFLAAAGYADRLIEPEASTATVPLAAQALGVSAGEIAKTLSFSLGEKAILIVMKGDARIQNRKFKDRFRTKAKMLPPERVEELVGHEPGGVCPFGVREDVAVYLDLSLQEYEYIYPAAGNDHSAVKLTPEELFRISGAAGWVDVSR
ncbi:MAG: YbaK/EbsC family protein [Anaerovoracaceae bacterium]|jgi:prolyl-tRNA editing enzyme YbaK/EbsC (Cys-tRNA(Pro) deacylase)